MSGRFRVLELSLLAVTFNLACLGSPPVLVELVDASVVSSGVGDAGSNQPTADAGPPRADAGPPRADAGPLRDGGTGLDAGRRDAAACGVDESLVQTALEVVGVELFTQANRVQGITERLSVTVRVLDSCTQLPWVTATVTAGSATDVVELAAAAFINPAGCTPVLQSPLLLVPIPGSQQNNPRVVVRWEGGQFSYDRRLCAGPACQCGPNTPRRNGGDGDRCQSDCDCANPFSCLAVPGRMEGRCAISCLEGLDCFPTSTRCLPQRPNNPPSTCEVEEDFCLTDSDCPVGFDCVSTGTPRRQCEDQRPVPGAPCNCPVDCGPLQACVDGPRGFPACERQCSRFQDCPVDNVCQDGLCNPQ